MNDTITKSEYVKLLSVAVILVNQDSIYLKRLGYRVVLMYGNITKDYIPLYDISLNTGLMPVARLVKKQMLLKEVQVTNSSFINEFSESYVDSFEEEGIVFSEQQYLLNDIFYENINNSLYVVAPTSYGKSELMMGAIKKLPQKKICILVPSKSLLTQTKKRVLDAEIEWISKIVSHPEMHEENLKDAVYVLTQERLARLLNVDRNLSFDILFVDEAHNLLDKSSRSELLASVISILHYRNPHVGIKYLTPFINDIKSLYILSTDNIELSFFIDEYIKSERFYLADFRFDRKYFNVYEQYMNSLYESRSSANTPVEYIIENAAQKNIIYFNRPKDIEKFVFELSEELEVVDDVDISIAVEELSNGFDLDYKLVESLKKGVVYHHGSMTDSVRNYVEFLFKKSGNIKYLVSSSTLLEGVNMPFERLFMMSCSKGIGNLTPSQFKNLVGRVNRFNEIFIGSDESLLAKLEPQVHIVASDSYMPPTANIETFIRSRAQVIKKLKDKPENVLLLNTKIDDSNKMNLEDALSRLENLENGIVKGFDKQYVSTSVGRLLIASNVSEIKVFEHEGEIQSILDSVEPESISNTNILLDIIYKSFIFFIEDDARGNKLSRLKNIEARMFYAMMLDWKIEKLPIKLMIRKFINYWETLVVKSPNTQVYVGKWGDEVKENGHLQHYTRMSRKSRKEKVNLAIVRIKEEEDFIEHVIFRFIDILSDMNLIHQRFYKLIKYGTEDAATILLIRNGLSRSVAELILREYLPFIDIDIDLGIVDFSPELPELMQFMGESILQIFEVQMNTKRAHIH